ncbi:MAG: hypothetical protein ABIY62_00330, partial [Ginsengibacter sp.]
MVLWILLQTSFFQNYIVGRVTHRLSKDLNTTVSIKHVDFELFDKMLLKGTLVLDHNHDTLLYAGAVKVSITDWFFFKNNIVLKYVGLDDAVINLNRKDSVWNYQFLMDYFSGSSAKKDTASSSVQLNLKQVELNNFKLWQEDKWGGTNMLVSLKSLNLNADTFDLNKNVIHLKTLTIDHPLFSQYDYDGNKPHDTTASISPPLQVVDAGTMQWNTDGWRVSVNKIEINDGGLAIEQQTDRPVYSEGFDDQHVIVSELNGTFKNFSFIKDTLTAQILLSGKERSDLVIKKLSADFKFTPKLMEFNKLDLVTNRSHLTDYY